MVRVLVVVVLLSAGLLTGCFGAEDPPPQDDPGAPQEEVSQEGFGTLKGTILTTDIEPVEDARVQVVEDTSVIAETTTPESGKYTITNIPPGHYRLHITSSCCKEHAQGVTIVEDEAVEVSVQLEPFSADDLQEGYVEQYEWTGFLECSVAYAGDELNVCGIAWIIPRLLGINETDDDFLHRWEVRPGVESVVGGMSWSNPAPASGDELSLFFEVSGMPNNGEDSPDADPSYARVNGASPLEFRADAGELVEYYDEEAHAYDFQNLEEELEVMFRVFASGDANVVYQQQFTVYWDVYYWEGAPEDATALPDA